MEMGYKKRVSPSPLRLEYGEEGNCAAAENF